MPELPEIITIRNDLNKELVGKKITKVRREKNYDIKPSNESFSGMVVNTTVKNVSNIAKLLTIELSSGNFIATHLSMSGVLLFNNSDPYVRVSLGFGTGDRLNYTTVRMFGFFEAWTKEQIDVYRADHGKDALDPTLTQDEFVTTLTSSKVPIKTALLNQRLISGMGNIYANDSLYMAKINPNRKTTVLTETELKNLFTATQENLKMGIEHRGSSIDRYKDIYGKFGWHQNHFKVYGKMGESCGVCEDKIVQEKLGGRATFYCPTCQPETDQLNLL